MKKNKKIKIKLISLVATPVLLLSVALATSITPKYIATAPEVPTGIGARLACSMHFVMGHDEAQIAQDIKVYSAMLAYLNYEFDEEEKTASAQIAGFKRTASWQPHMGCVLNYEGVTRKQVYWSDPLR